MTEGENNENNNRENGKEVWVAGRHGGSVALLGVKPAVTYLEMAAASYQERITLATAEMTLLADNTVIGVRSAAGRLGSITVTPPGERDAETLIVRLVTYKE